MPGIVEVDLEAGIEYINSIKANLLTYNGSYPGPTIRAKRKDIFNLNFKNSLPNTTEKNILGPQLPPACELFPDSFYKRRRSRLCFVISFNTRLERHRADT